jgi:SPP1 gp7 family putative phage head morphogenesis protein
VALLKLGLNVPFRAALEAAERRKSLMPGTYYELPAEMRAQAFTVSGLTAIDQVQSVLDELKRTLNKGGTFRDFKRWAATNDVGLPGHRLETIFRNGVQQAYNAGHWRRFERDSDERPYLMYDAINDSRTRPAHRALDGVIRPVGDAFWRTHSPALGHRCRCRLLSLSQDEARSRGGVTQNPPAEGQPDPGWGAKPTDHRPQLQAAISRRRAQCEVSQFASKPMPPIWCDGPGAKLLGKLAASAADPKPRQAMPQMVRDLATLQLARDATDTRGFKDRTLTLGPVTPTRELYEATGEDDRSLFVASVALQASYLRRTLAKTGDARIEPRLLQFAYQAAQAGGFSAAPGSAWNPLVMNVFPVAGVLLRWVWEVRPGRRALVLRDVRPA